MVVKTPQDIKEDLQYNKYLRTSQILNQDLKDIQKVKMKKLLITKSEEKKIS